jgi:hypothetical protein
MRFTGRSRRDVGSEGAREGFDLWGQNGWPQTDLVGESHYAREIRGLLPRRLGAGGEEVTTQVELRCEPGNKHDPNAVQVRATTGIVGYLSREDARRYCGPLGQIQGTGLTPLTSARIWGRDEEDYDTGKSRFVGSVRLDLPEPHMMLPLNTGPSVPFRLLPVGGAVRVTGEENHRDAVSPFLNTHGECWAYATVHPHQSSGAARKPCAEVRLDDQICGILTPKMSGELLPVVDYLQERGERTAVRAIVKGNRLKAEVVLYTARAPELKDDWFAAMGGTIASPAADWYPDPHGLARLRYWDGRAWTEHVAD